jgi:uncharacterized protein YgbK (DUF1537 family)
VNPIDTPDAWATLPQLLAAYPPPQPIQLTAVERAVRAARSVLVVLDDDPTGTQAVCDVPVLTSWDTEDFAWAFAQLDQANAAPAVFVEVNTRSLDPDAAAQRNRSAVANALRAAAPKRIALRFASRSDSTLRGHFPLEPDAIAEALVDAGHQPPDGVLLVPAFPEAGRITIGGTHFVRAGEDRVQPVGQTEFARDPTFGYTSSDLADYAVERSAGRWKRADVRVLTLDLVRTGPEAIAAALSDVSDGAPIAADCATEDDLLALALGVLHAEADGLTLLPRSGPSFIRAMIAQRRRPPLTSAQAFEGATPGAKGGLIVVGSHVGVSTRQLAQLRRTRPGLAAMELDVASLVANGTGRGGQDLADGIVQHLAEGNVVLYSSRTPVTGQDAAGSLAIARRVSDELAQIAARVIDSVRPRFVIAKGGITSSDVAQYGLRMRRATVRGCLLPGIVSLWLAAEGPGRGIPFTVFAGNVGDDDALAQVVDLLSAPGLTEAAPTRAVPSTSRRMP